MSQDIPTEKLTNRQAPLEMTAKEFRNAGHQLIDQIAEFLESLPNRKVVETKSISEIQDLLSNEDLPVHGTETFKLLQETTKLLVNHSLFNGHPDFWGYVTSSAAPIGMLGDFLASAVNQNVEASW